MAKVIALCAGGLELDFRVGQSGLCRQRLATAAMFLWSCVAQAPSRGDGPHHSLHASESYLECNEDLILFFFSFATEISLK